MYKVQLFVAIFLSFHVFKINIFYETFFIRSYFGYIIWNNLFGQYLFSSTKLEENELEKLNYPRVRERGAEHVAVERPAELVHRRLAPAARVVAERAALGHENKKEQRHL